LSHGILNEIYYPRVDHACTRDLGFLVTEGQIYFSEESGMPVPRRCKSHSVCRRTRFATPPSTFRMKLMIPDAILLCA